MSPELLNPDRFGFKNCLPTKGSDCYALGMVILEVLSGKSPFKPDRDLIVVQKVVEGERPGRPQGARGQWFTDELWKTLEGCWSPHPKNRPAIGAVLKQLERLSTTWRPLPPSATPSVSDDVQTASDDESRTTTSHPCMFPHLIQNLTLTSNCPPQRTEQMCILYRAVINPRFHHRTTPVVWWV